MPTKSAINQRRKAAQAELAAIFGCESIPYSGRGPDKSDTNHPTLFLDSKSRVKHDVWTLRDALKKKAKGRPIVLGIKRVGSPGMIVCVHSDDLRTMFDAWLQGNDDEAPPFEVPNE